MFPRFKSHNWYTEHVSDAVSGWAIAQPEVHPEFGASVNPIPTKGADYAQRITDCPPGLENITKEFCNRGRGLSAAI